MKKSKDTVNIVDQKQVEKQLKHIGTARLRCGHKCFKVDNKTGVAVPAVMDSTATFTGGVKHKVVVESGYTYINALNIKNAEKKFRNLS